MLQKLPKYSLYSGKKLFLQHSLGFPAKKRYLIRVSSPVKIKKIRENVAVPSVAIAGLELVDRSAVCCGSWRGLVLS